MPLYAEEEEGGGLAGRLVKGAAIVIVAAFVIFLFTGGDSSSMDDETGAYLMCRKFVEDRLKAPSTVKFADDISSEVTTKMGPGHYVVQSHLDAQNGFGAMVRGEYRCEVATADRGRNWRLLDLSINTRE